MSQPSDSQRYCTTQVGRRRISVTMLSGSIVRIWGALESVLQRHEGILSRSDRTMRVVRVPFQDGSSLISAEPFKNVEVFEM